MATFLVAHGAWSASWAWRKMHPLMQAAGHRLVVPCYTGLGERRAAAGPHITLETHVTDVVDAIEMEDLHDFVLIGHSYGGMVATAVADRMPERVRRLVYLDAFVPGDGQCVLDLQPEAHRARVLELARREGDGWKLPAQALPPDTPPDDVAWITPRRVDQSLATFTAPVRLHGRYQGPRTYVFCTRVGPADSFRRFAEHARADAAWDYAELDASHSPHVTAPEQLMQLLVKHT